MIFHDGAATARLRAAARARARRRHIDIPNLRLIIHFIREPRIVIVIKLNNSL